MPKKRVKILRSVKCHVKVWRTGEPCKRFAIMGGTVCPAHGGKAPQVKRKAAERVQEALAELINIDRMLRECAAVAYSDIRKLYDASGKLLPIKDWPDDLAAAVSSTETVKRNLDSGDGLIDDIFKLKVWDKMKALEMLFKHKGLLTEKIEVSLTVNVETRLKAGRERVANARGK